LHAYPSPTFVLPSPRISFSFTRNSCIC
jgi:hypothetical protein